MKVGNQIQLSERDGRCVVSIQDTEIFDLVEDFIVQKGFEFQVVLPATHSGLHEVLFESGVSVQTVYQLLSELNHAEIDRIASINTNH